MNIILLTPAVLFVLVLIFILPVLVKLYRQGHSAEVTPDWLENFSPDTYEPMEYLLAEEDFEFLVRQPGFESSFSRKLRKDRVRIFRLYLDRLIADFNRLHSYARFQLSQSTQDGKDNSALLGQLVLLRLRFSLTVLRVEAGLLLWRLGRKPVVVSHVIGRLSEMAVLMRASVVA